MKQIRLAVLLILAAFATRLCADPPEPLGRRVVEPFDYHGVRLDDGPLLRQVLEVRNDYLRIPNDDYLKGFRQRAGRPAPGDDLGGWYTSDTFHVFGQILSGLARMYAATGDPACKQKLDALIAGWAECIEPDGCFYFTRKPGASTYIYEKMVCGLVDASIYGKNPDALKHLARITDWAEKHLSRNRPFGEDVNEWYTLSENLYRAYLLTGEDRYRQFAKYWEYTDYWNLYRDNKDIFSARGSYHAYSHVNTLSGAAMAYRVTGEHGYLETITHAYDFLQAHEVYATGGYGPGEHLLPPAPLAASLNDQQDHFETQCGSWAAFKLSKYLTTFTGNARYGDWVERLMFNGIGASLHMTADGQVTYYARYSPAGAEKTYTVGRWPCCAGTRIQAVADYDDLIYYKDADSLYVSLYTPSTVSWSHNGSEVTLRQRTSFPEQPDVDMTISLPHGENHFALKLRTPSWLAAPMRVQVNSQDAETKLDPNGWATLDRTWHDGDHVKLSLPMALRAEPFPPNAPSPSAYALCYGPVVLALRSPDSNPAARIDFNHLNDSFVPSRDEPLNFHLAADPAVLARPYYAFGLDQPYFLYLDPKHPWSRVPLNQLHLSGNWSQPSSLTVTTDSSAAVEFQFRGTAVRWTGMKFDDAAVGELLVDGKPSTRIDLYDPNRGLPAMQAVANLPDNLHTVRWRSTKPTNPKSKGNYLNFASFEVMRSPPATQK